MDAKSTETVNRRQQGIDEWPTNELVQSLLEGQLAAVAAIQVAVPALAAAADATAERLSREGNAGRLIYAGAGSSGRLAMQDGIELLPTYSWPTERVVYLLAGGDAALTGSVEGAEDEADTGAARVSDLDPGPNDVLIAVAASGTTPFTLGCAKTARAAGALVVSIASNPDSPLLAQADHPILTETGAEPVGGSTRMKAGTAQKVALNILSTATMIRLGRVYDGYMVDVVASNAKLVTRSAQILADLADLPFDQAQALLAKAGAIKPAVLMSKGLSADEAEQALKQSGGNLRRALALASGN